METIKLPGTGRATTRLGFGGSGLMGSIGRKESLRLLDAAYDCGVRHFDTAPLYGGGEAESCVGDFLARHRGEVTITTKYGLLPPSPADIRVRMIRAAKQAARPMLSVVPAVKNRLARAAAAVGPKGQDAEFSPEAARASLQTSLRNLRSERIDLWLLHEATAESLAAPGAEGLLGVMQDAVASGEVGAFGVGSDGWKIPGLWAEQRAFCDVMQFDWTPQQERPRYPGAFLLHHSVLNKGLGPVEAELAADERKRKRWSDETGVDLGQKGNLAALLMRTAMKLNPESVILFFSRKAANIEANVRAAEDDKLSAPALRLHELMQEPVNS